MIKFNFSKIYKNNYLNKKEEVFDKFNTYDYIGWDRKVILNETIIEKVKQVKENSKLLLVIGVGGSFLGSKALYDAFNPYFNTNYEVIYCGYTLSSNYLTDLIEYINKYDYSINVISKSGGTKEILKTYDLIKTEMLKKYDEKELKNRIFITTGTKGKLYEEAIKNEYTLFNIPDDIGGRYSMMTDAHLFPLAFNIDIKKLIDGYNNCNLKEESYLYASTRKTLFDNNKIVEDYIFYEEKYTMFGEWLKQLFAESEGKDGKGIFPVSSMFSRDLHSLGQFIQEGNKILFETIITIDKNKELSDLIDINNKIIQGVKTAHSKGNVPINTIEIDELNEYNIGLLIKFFFYAAAYSSILFGVNPFNQPGVEKYKEEIEKL